MNQRILKDLDCQGFYTKERETEIYTQLYMDIDTDIGKTCFLLSRM